MATDAEARAAGFLLPEDGDLIREGDDAIRHNARTTLELTRGATWARGIATASTLRTPQYGVHEVRSGALSEQLGLPLGLTGTLEILPVDGRPEVGMSVARWTPRIAQPQIWQSVRNSDGNWTPWASTTPGEIRPDAFGEIGGADDHPALQAWLNHLADNGGVGALDARSYRISKPLTLNSPRHGFRIHGAGNRETLIRLDSSTQATPLSIVSPAGVTIADFGIGGSSASRLCAHGFSFSNPVGCNADRIRVFNYQQSAGLFFLNDPAEVAEGNSMNECLALGGGVANNGFLIESCRKSQLNDCWVYALNKAGSPSYGLQMKNSCQDSHIRGGGVRGAIAGVAFGSDGDSTQNTRAHVSGVTVSDVFYGFISSKTTNSHVSLIIDYQSQPVGRGYPVRIGAGCRGLTVDATVRNVPAGQTVAYIGSSGNTVKLAPLETAPAKLVELVPLLKDSTVIYDGPAEHLSALDNSGDASNVLVSLRGLAASQVAVDRRAGVRAFTWDAARSARQMIYGDTGSRLVTANLANGSAINLTIRREGSRVDLSLRSWTHTDPAAVIYRLPAGFTPAQTPLIGFIGYSTNPPEIAVLQIVNGALNQVTAHKDGLYAQISFTTNDPWPDAMPGTAIGAPAPMSLTE